MSWRIALLILIALEANAQSTGGALLGRISDPVKAPVAGVEVAVTQTETGALRRTTTDGSGDFFFAELPIGHYELTATHPGFKRALRRGIELHVSDRLTINLSLAVGDVAQEITVEASSDQVQVDSSEQSTLISGDQVRELQLNGRSFMTLLELVPGVASNMSDRMDPNSTPDVAINGARSSAGSFNIDGGSNSDIIVGSSSQNTFTSVDTIAEFTVLTSTFAAEYGRGGFSQVNVVTRGGGKQYHGSAFYFLRNDALDAKDYLSHQTLPLRLNNFGYTFSGPLKKSKNARTFFFFAQEFNRIFTRGEAVNTIVPTANMKAGNFAGVSAILDPADNNTPFPDARIPATRFDANAVKLLNLFPSPNWQGPGGLNFTSAAGARQNWREEMIRLDHNFLNGARLYGRYTRDTADVENPYGGSAVTSANMRFPGIGATQADRPGQNAVVNFTQTVGPRILHSLNSSFARRYFDIRAIRDDANRDTLGLTLQELFPDNEGRVIPGVTLGSNFAALAVARKGHKELFTIEAADNWNLTLGKHLVKFGGLWFYGANLEQPNNANTAGTYTYTTNATRHPVANMLLGIPSNYTEVEKIVWSDVRFSALEFFVQDDWRIHPRLILNYGLRHTNFFNPHDRNGVATNFSPAFYKRENAVPVNPTNGNLGTGGDPLNGIIIAGKNSPYGNNITNHQTNLLAPRFGFAYSPDRRTAIRGGWGMFYTRPLIGTFINNAFDNPPFSRTVNIVNPSFIGSPTGSLAGLPPSAVTALGQKMKAPTVHQWSFEIQREIFPRLILKTAYVGSRGLRLMRPININNTLPGEAAARGINVQAARPYLGWGTITVREPSSGSNYHALQVSLNQRLTRKISYGIAYTWSKSIDDGSSDRGGSDVPPDSRNARAERAVSDHDRTQIFTSNFIWSVPGLKHWKPLTAGWQLSGITRLWTGRPGDVQLSADVAGIGGTQNQRPDVIASSNGPRTVEEWFNRNAFARPRTATFGNMGRNALRLPGVNKWDLAIFKSFKVPLEKPTTATFRFEAFNAFNHPNFAIVGTSLTTTATAVTPTANSFGVVTGTRDARVVQLALKVNF